MEEDKHLVGLFQCTYAQYEENVLELQEEKNDEDDSSSNKQPN